MLQAQGSPKARRLYRCAQFVGQTKRELAQPARCTVLPMTSHDQRVRAVQFYDDSMNDCGRGRDCTNVGIEVSNCSGLPCTHSAQGSSTCYAQGGAHDSPTLYNMQSSGASPPRSEPRPSFTSVGFFHFLSIQPMCAHWSQRCGRSTLPQDAEKQNRGRRLQQGWTTTTRWPRSNGA